MNSTDSVRPRGPFLIIILPIDIHDRETAIQFIRSFVPLVAAGRDREEPAKQIISGRGDDEPAEEIDVVDVLGTDRNLSADGTDEANDVDQDTGDVCGITSPGETERIVVWTTRAGTVKFFDLIVAFTYEVVVGNDDSSDRRQEDRVGREISREVVGRREQMPQYWRQQFVIIDGRH